MKDKIGVTETVLGSDQIERIPREELSSLIKLLKVLDGEHELVRGKGSKVTKIVTENETFVIGTRFLETVRIIKDFS